MVLPIKVAVTLYSNINKLYYDKLKCMSKLYVQLKCMIINFTFYNYACDISFPFIYILPKIRILSK